MNNKGDGVRPLFLAVMSDASTYKSRIPTDPGYAAALGQAIYNFVYMEWIVVWIIEKLAPGYLRQSPGQKMSGRIANEFKAAISDCGHIGPETRALLSGIADRFSTSKDRRNQLLHAHPFTGERGAQMLGRSEPGQRIAWDISLVSEAAKEFEDLAIDANGLFYERLHPVLGQKARL